MTFIQNCPSGINILNFPRSHLPSAGAGARKGAAGCAVYVWFVSEGGGRRWSHRCKQGAAPPHQYFNGSGRPLPHRARPRFGSLPSTISHHPATSHDQQNITWSSHPAHLENQEKKIFGLQPHYAALGGLFMQSQLWGWRKTSINCLC